MEGWKEGWKEGWMEGRKDGWIDGWMDGWMEVSIDEPTGRWSKGIPPFKKHLLKAYYVPVIKGT